MSQSVQSPSSQYPDNDNECPQSKQKLELHVRASGRSADFAGAVLIGLELQDADLRGADFSGADLSGCNLAGAQLSGAKLTKAILHRANLSGAELLGADLTDCDLTEVSADRVGLGRTRLTRACCFGAQLRHATLTQADLSGADFRAACLESARLKEASLDGSSLQRADLQRADLEGARLGGSNFFEADLRGARLRNVRASRLASFIHADIRDVDFSGAYLLRRQIHDENYLFEFRSQSRSHAALYWIWWATSDCGRSMLRWTAWIALTWLIFGTAFFFLEIDYGTYPTVLSPYYFSLVTLTTLGYGDVLPTSIGAQVVVMIEVLLGYLMLGGLLSIVSSKMGRRAD